MTDWKKIKKKSLGEIPQTASTNLQIPATPSFTNPERKTKTPTVRTKPLGLKVREEFYWQLKELALKEKCLLVEVLEKALECYQRGREKERVKIKNNWK